MKPTTTESWVLVTLLLYAIDRVKTQAIFDRDPYESRREALSGSRLLKVLVLYQMLKTKSQLHNNVVTQNRLKGLGQDIHKCAG